MRRDLILLLQHETSSEPAETADEIAAEPSLKKARPKGEELSQGSSAPVEPPKMVAKNPISTKDIVSLVESKGLNAAMEEIAGVDKLYDFQARSTLPLLEGGFGGAASKKGKEISFSVLNEGRQADQFSCHAD